MLSELEPADRAARVKRLGLEAGFDDVGIAPPGPHEESVLFAEWLDAGYHGEMEWLHRNRRRRMDPARVLPGVQSVIVAALDYDTSAPRSTEVPPADDRGWISRYAWGDDYHARIEERLAAFCDRLAAEAPGADFRYYVDHGPVLEKAYARRAGLGWMGKHTNLIHPERGSFFFLAVVLTDVRLPADTPVVDHCGTCTACLDACPTDAFVAPWVLDARRCISYVTIEATSPPSDEIAAGIGKHVYGCDICQDVCPWNRKPMRPNRDEHRPADGLLHPSLPELIAMDEAAFTARFEGTAIARRGHEAFVRAARAAQER